ncbi:MAG: hypothetical protein ACYDCQ_21200 [Dehalococcoidia bacterium]
MASRDDLYRLIDALPDELLDEAARRLGELDNPLLRALLNTEDDPYPDRPRLEHPRRGVRRCGLRYALSGPCWLPADELTQFNAAIVGQIKVIARFPLLEA